MEVCNLLKELINIESFSDNELNICNFLYDLLSKEGFVVEKIPVDNNGYNIRVKVGNPKIYLAAHLDTVKPFIEFKETEDEIFGRGSCDTKSCVASMICAAIKCKSEGINDFGLVFTVGEENNFRGVKAMEQLPFVVVGEPTDFKFINSHYGILVLKIISRGKKAHSSELQLGINAIDLLVDALKEFRSIKIHKNSSVTVAKINGGIADNIVPDYAEAILSFRISPDDKSDYLESVRSIKNIDVEKVLEIPSVFSPLPSWVSDTGIIVKYCTELSYFKKGFVFGPGDIKFAHSDEEHIKKSDLRKAVDCYCDFIKSNKISF